MSPSTHRAGADDARVDAAQVKLPADGEDELHRVHAESLDEFAASGVRFRADFDDGAADLDP